MFLLFLFVIKVTLSVQSVQPSESGLNLRLKYFLSFCDFLLLKVVISPSIFQLSTPKFFLSEMALNGEPANNSSDSISQTALFGTAWNLEVLQSGQIYDFWITKLVLIFLGYGTVIGPGYFLVKTVEKWWNSKFLFFFILLFTYLTLISLFQQIPRDFNATFFSIFFDILLLVSQNIS